MFFILLSNFFIVYIVQNAGLINAVPVQYLCLAPLLKYLADGYDVVFDVAHTDVAALKEA